MSFARSYRLRAPVHLPVWLAALRVRHTPLEPRPTRSRRRKSQTGPRSPSDIPPVSPGVPQSLQRPSRTTSSSAIQDAVVPIEDSRRTADGAEACGPPPVRNASPREESPRSCAPFSVLVPRKPPTVGKAEPVDDRLEHLSHQVQDKSPPPCLDDIASGRPGGAMVHEKRQRRYASREEDRPAHENTSLAFLPVNTTACSLRRNAQGLQDMAYCEGTVARRAEGIRLFPSSPLESHDIRATSPPVLSTPKQKGLPVEEGQAHGTAAEISAELEGKRGASEESLQGEQIIQRRTPKARRQSIVRGLTPSPQEVVASTAGGHGIRPVSHREANLGKYWMASSLRREAGDGGDSLTFGKGIARSADLSQLTAKVARGVEEHDAALSGE